MHRLDHIVLGSHTLEVGTDFVKNKLGLSLSEIGYHQDMGTHNRVIKISDNENVTILYLNIGTYSLTNKVVF